MPVLWQAGRQNEQDRDERSTIETQQGGTITGKQAYGASVAAACSKLKGKVVPGRPRKPAETTGLVISKTSVSI